jgi:hypothetical protein
MNMHRLLVCMLAWGASGLISSGQEAVSNPVKRQATLDLAANLLATNENQAEKLPAELVDPFNPPGFAAAPAPNANKPAPVLGPVTSDLDLLERIAPHITPSGMFLMNGAPVLLFREKKLKVGDALTITFEGSTYVIIISAVDQTSFKIRYKHAEVTRPIKSRKAP